ncbi:MAG: hypothetical protein LBV21_03965 [Candidatus Adiutrix sp.]|jgi:hypothetical protein|nr:hypothetical protein [Candidatus Adiutrix sp.]
MFKKFVAGLILSSCLWAVGPAAAQMPPMGQLPPEMLELLKKEPPLAQADVDNYLKIMPQLIQVKDPAALPKLYADSGLTEIRLGLITAKINLGLALASGVTAQQINLDQVPEPMRPTDQEVELVKKNQAKIQAATMQMQPPAAAQ